MYQRHDESTIRDAARRNAIRNILIGAAFPLSLALIWNLKPFAPADKAIAMLVAVFIWAAWFRLSRTIRFLASKTASGPDYRQQGQAQRYRPAPQGQQPQSSIPGFAPGCVDEEWER